MEITRLRVRIVQPAGAWSEIRTIPGQRGLGVRARTTTPPGAPAGEYDALAREGWPVKLLLTVHNDLVFESPPQLGEEVGAALKHEMEGVYALSGPLEVDIGIADNWAMHSAGAGLDGDQSSNTAAIESAFSARRR